MVKQWAWSVLEVTQRSHNQAGKWKHAEGYRARASDRGWMLYSALFVWLIFLVNNVCHKMSPLFISITWIVPTRAQHLMAQTTGCKRPFCEVRR